MDRKLIDYLPIFIQDYAEIKAIMEAEQTSGEKAWTDAENVMCDQFVADATEYGVKRRESLLGITPKATDTMEERKFNILVRMNEQLPYTLEMLKSILLSMCGENGYSVTLDHGQYLLSVKLSLSNEKNVEAVKKLLERMVPANMVTIVSLFNTHGILAGFTHEQLGVYTQKQVREETLPIAR